MQSVFLFVPKICSGVEVRALVTQDYPRKSWQTMSIMSLLVQEHCGAECSSVSASKRLKLCAA